MGKIHPKVMEMTTLKEALQSIMSITADNEPKSPMHVGEVMK
jgi:hypothetical protein